jgi:hypothetical protein
MKTLLDNFDEWVTRQVERNSNNAAPDIGEVRIWLTNQSVFTVAEVAQILEDTKFRLKQQLLKKQRGR